MSQPLFASLFDETERRPLTVSELTESVRKAIEARFSSVWVEGEISNFKAHSSGHWYFTIKDEGAQLRAKCFRSANSRIRFRPTDGLHVRARGRLTVYEARGEYELIVEALDPVGAGALQVAFEQLRDRLQAEGLFSPRAETSAAGFSGTRGRGYLADRRGHSRHSQRHLAAHAHRSRALLSRARAGRRRRTRHCPRHQAAQRPS